MPFRKSCQYCTAIIGDFNKKFFKETKLWIGNMRLIGIIISFRSVVCLISMTILPTAAEISMRHFLQKQLRQPVYIHIKISSFYI